ncbi:MAG: glycosyltransferase family 4 protein [Phycisphaerales bacterium]
MHVALIVDHDRWRREHAMVGRVAAGLRDRDIQITAVLPEAGRLDAVADEPPLDGAASVYTPMQVPPWMRRARARQLAASLPAGVPDVIHAVGEDAWVVALDLARELDRPVTLEVWTAELIKRIPPGRAASRVAGYIAPTEPIAEAIRHRVDAHLVSVVPIGVEIPSQPRQVLTNRADSMTLAILGSGRDLVGYRAVLTGLSRLISDLPQIQVCLELRGPGEHEIWRHARRLDLLGHISSVVDAAMHRPLLTGCDVLVLPERQGQVRSIVLEALAAGMPAVTADDPYLDILVSDETALIVDYAVPDDWTDKLHSVLTDPAVAPRLAASARSSVAELHRPAEQADRLAAAFTQVVSGGAHAFG